ncbi:hypothetical protein O181_049736 [Austropuccinia psidii MF-1]|uniref:DUF4218 domain-containing protein n=1 Tax=Austropuccinia psidii MF-1 TaxID=1389203 RepID=A0A9Q3E0H3_9BASI|nr:hypothetical protein [Austropuccinia psidii MF-1]
MQSLLHLISITHILRLHEVSNKQIHLIKNHIEEYCGGIQELFPNFPLKPNHHLALHIPECLERFGPASNWSAWVFERVIGWLKNIPTNNHLSSMSSTLLQKWVAAQRLRWILPHLREELPEELSIPLQKFLSTENSPETTDESTLEQCSFKPGGSLKYETLTYDEQKLLISKLNKIDGTNFVMPDKAYSEKNSHKTHSVLSRWVLQYEYVKIGRVTYSTHKLHFGNSIIEYFLEGDKTHKDFNYGKINQIFYIQRPFQQSSKVNLELWFQITCFCKLNSSDKKKNIFLQWQESQIDIAYSEVTATHYIRLHEIISHCASWDLPRSTFGIKNPVKLMISLRKSLEKNDQCP